MFGLFGDLAGACPSRTIGVSIFAATPATLRPLVVNYAEGSGDSTIIRRLRGEWPSSLYAIPAAEGTAIRSSLKLNVVPFVHEGVKQRRAAIPNRPFQGVVGLRGLEPRLFVHPAQKVKVPVGETGTRFRQSG